ncbi:unnamed protein product [Caenorhabditis brenneri]
MEPEKEFPVIPKEFNDLETIPNPYEITAKELILRNHSKFAILFKVKCTNNTRLKIEECSDILRPGNEASVPIKKLVDNVDGDSLYVMYALVGKQWHDERMSAYRCWERAKKQDVPTKCITVRIGKAGGGKNKTDKVEKIEKEKTKSED